MGGNFGKPGLNLSAMNSSARVLTLQHRTCDTNTSFVVRMAMEEAAHSDEEAAERALPALPLAVGFWVMTLSTTVKVPSVWRSQVAWPAAARRWVLSVLHVCKRGWDDNKSVRTPDVQAQ